MIVCSLLLKSRKKLAHNVFDTSAADVGLVHDITDTDCGAQNGCTRSHISTTFKHQLLAMWTGHCTEDLLHGLFHAC